MKPLLRKLLLGAVTIFLLQKGQSQSLEQKLVQPKPSCQEMFSNAMDVLPELQMQSQFDSIRFVIRFIEQSCSATLETFNLKVLLAIELNQFNAKEYYDTESIRNLDKAAFLARTCLTGYGTTPLGQLKYYDFTSKWAARLLKTRRLTTDESLICRVIAGFEPAPSLYIIKNKTQYPYFFELQQAATERERKGPHDIGSITVGAWIPTNNLQLLGNHPSVGLQFGRRNNLNEIDVTIQFRFIRSRGKYTVLRNETHYDLTHFFGGYIGLDYSRYLFSKKDVEFGWLGGIGYDGFDINSSEEKDYLKPYGIGSLNLNTGPRFNYYFSGNDYLGICFRYNLISYRNKGGSSLKGDAFSIDLILSFNGKPY